MPQTMSGSSGRMCLKLCKIRSAGYMAFLSTPCHYRCTLPPPFWYVLGSSHQKLHSADHFLAYHHQGTWLHCSSGTVALSAALCCSIYLHIIRRNPIRTASSQSALHFRLIIARDNRLRSTLGRSSARCGLSGHDLRGCGDLSFNRFYARLALQQRGWADEEGHCNCHADLDRNFGRRDGCSALPG